MSTLKTNNVQVGQSGTATNNFTLYQPSTPDGTVRLGVGNTGATTADVITANNSGNVGIGTSSPSGKLNVSDGTVIGEINPYSASSGCYIGTRSNHSVLFETNAIERARLSAAGGFSVGTTADPGAGAIYATGNITAYYSDDRLKTRLGKIENALDKLCSLEGFYYEANETAQALGYEAKREVGVSAQQVQAVMPEIVAPAPIDPKYLTVQYERALPLLIEAIKELREEIQALKG